MQDLRPLRGRSQPSAAATRGRLLQSLPAHRRLRQRLQKNARTLYIGPWRFFSHWICKKSLLY
ncbi:Malonyl CoA-acyl carrier protein transacylase [Pseudomonas chlororaphis subsp. aureofaciens]|uniref:Malonyl CoA-acyl carrier protein transacylase n=1 Tax=Pseudomonas chlororaphis subsp. aureofaciens TaxID=587851 RepID=A0AAD0ZGI1_9PSED|nr:Malonyl CoA-acyl carrier protein transacylase [Pseudomonas chlororaphis subsp. aureofaciens]AZE34592.1 Malonyl CoA-acyl carrier protein transacylase [Pseudomonas chlororaphis subsp. aureofaciens]